MSKPAIIVDQLGKRYKIGLRENRKALKHRRLSEALTGLLTAPWRRFKTLSEQTTAESEFWALKDISFEVQPGEVVGIIGRNGAGKSTLLKILSRITEPTTGQAIIRGRIGSLLEVGTGFNPELTGRENIYLNGALLGMRKVEIEAKFDEIVAFAGIDKFLDTPVKRYSSGMYVRLAFAVAAHLEPEILIVDEVLAVGDMEFQRKCLGKMDAVAKHGRTVLFVSHNMAAVQHLCTRVALLQNGQLAHIGETADIIREYSSAYRATEPMELEQRRDREGNGALRLTRIRLDCNGAADTRVAYCGSSLTISLGYATFQPVHHPVFWLGIYDSCGSLLFHLNSKATGLLLDRVPSRGQVACELPRLPLPPGQYFFNAAVSEAGGEMLDRVESATSMIVEAGDFFGTGDVSCSRSGRFLVDHSWVATNAR